MSRKLHLKTVIIQSTTTELPPADLSKIAGGARNASGFGRIKKFSGFGWTSEKITRAERRHKGDNPLWDFMP